MMYVLLVGLIALLAFALALFITNRNLREDLFEAKADIYEAGVDFNRVCNTLAVTQRDCARYISSLRQIKAMRTDNMANIGRRMANIADKALAPS